MLKKPIVALIICVIVVVLSTIVSVHRDLDPRCEEIRGEFTESGGIADQLNVVCTASGGFVKLAEKYEVDEYSSFNAEDIATSLRFAVGNTEPSALADLYRMLLSETDKLRTSLRLKDMSADDAKLFDEFETEYLAAQNAIGSSDYNSDVTHYLTKELGFFSRLMAKLCFVKLPEQFA